MKMFTVPLEGTLSSVSFYPDDTIETVLRWIALALETHPARLFTEVMTTLPSDYYSSNPMRWSELFYRLSYANDVIHPDALRAYVESRRPRAEISIREITKEEWESREGDLSNLYSSAEDIHEWRILGLPVEHSIVLPNPPRDVPVPSARIPIPNLQRMYEAIHPYPITSIRATVLPSDASDKLKLLYYPLFVADTPPNIEGMRGTLEETRKSLEGLLALPAPKPSSVSIVRARWYIPLVQTHFTAVRNRFEQMFYGLTLSKETPYVGYSVTKAETMRSKFYVEDPKNKVPWLKEELVRGWYMRTQPQRRRPTLLLYRGKNRTSFDRIILTETDIVLQSERGPGSKHTLDELRTELSKWLESLDSIFPFLEAADIHPSRWELADMFLHASYDKEIHAFDLRKLPCIRSVFGFQNGQFRLLRADVEAVSADKLQAYQLFQQDPDVDRQTLIEVVGVSGERADELLDELRSPDQMTVNLDKALKVYPTIEFTERDVNIRFVTDPERTIQYANVLRYILTNDTEAIRDLCELPPDDVPARAGSLRKGGADDDDEEDLLDFGDDEEEKPAVVVKAPAPAEKEVASYMYPVSSKVKATYNYFNRRLEQFDPDTFDQSFYNRECDKPRQAIVLTAADKERIRTNAGEDYTYDKAPAPETLELVDPEGTVICPPYWCIRDEIPLREDQLLDCDGDLCCPVCKGKVRKNDSSDDPIEFTVIRRDLAAKYPDYLKRESTINKRKIPCCYLSPRSEPKVVSSLKEDETYILRETVSPVPALRWAYVSDDLAARLHMSVNYKQTTDKNYLVFGKEDLFRIGLGRPSQTLPILFKSGQKIPRPRDAKENVFRCSFFRTRRARGEGDTTLDQLVSGVDADFQNGTLPFLEELEYTTSFLKCEVIRVDSKSGDMICGFWRDVVGGDRFILLVVDTEIVGYVKRERIGSRKGAYRTVYQIDARKFESAEYLTKHHEEACASNIPTVDDAIQEIRRIGEKSYQVLMDPFDRIQAVLVPGTAIFPVTPTTRKTFEGVVIRKGFSDLTADDLPTRESVYKILNESAHEGFHTVRDHTNASNEIVEIELKSGFRIPIQTEQSESFQSPTEVVETVRTQSEETLVNGKPNPEDAAAAQQISYEGEMYEFLMYSLAHDIELDDSGTILNATNKDLRAAIESRSERMYTLLEKWFARESYKDTVEKPATFINKIRAPCGQFKAKDSCNKSTLCGWHKNDCRIRIRPSLDVKSMLRRLAKSLRTNDKQRSLVLDARLSPFFSTVLYLEMPNELFTTSV